MSVRTLQGRLAAEARHRPNANHEDLRREYAAAKLEDFIKKTVDSAPPLTPEQRARLFLLLSGGPDAVA